MALEYLFSEKYKFLLYNVYWENSVEINQFKDSLEEKKWIKKYWHLIDRNWRTYEEVE